MELKAPDKAEVVDIARKPLTQETISLCRFLIMGNVQMDERFEKSIARLKAMGIKLYVDNYGNNDAYILMDIPSVLGFFLRKITYPTSESWIDGDYMITHVWKGEKNPLAIAPPAGTKIVNKKGETETRLA